MNRLGETIRAARMGFYWTGTCYMRTSGDGPFRVDISPEGWENGVKDIVDLLPVARVKTKRAFTVYVNENAEIV